MDIQPYVDTARDALHKHEFAQAYAALKEVLYPCSRSHAELVEATNAFRNAARGGPGKYASLFYAFFLKHAALYLPPGENELKNETYLSSLEVLEQSRGELDNSVVLKDARSLVASMTTGEGDMLPRDSECIARAFELYETMVLEEAGKDSFEALQMLGEIKSNLSSYRMSPLIEEKLEDLKNQVSMIYYGGSKAGLSSLDPVIL